MLQFVALLKLHRSAADFKRLFEIDEEMASRAELDNWIQKADTTKEDSELDIDEE